MDVPKPISPRAHRRFDNLALPGIAALAFLARRRHPRAAAVMAGMALAEGSAQVTTDYPPPVLLSWMDFREHNRMAVVHGVFFAALGWGLPGLSRAERGVILGLSAIPLALAVLSDTSPQARTRALEDEARPR